MHSRLAEALGLTLAPVAVLLTDEKPAVAMQFKPGGRGCVAAVLLAAAKGRVGVFDRQTFGCPGGGTGLGFGDCYVGFPIDRLLSTGGEAELANGYTYDMGEGERFLESPQIAERWARALPYREVPTEFVVVKPLDQVADPDEVSLIHLFVNADQLSALVTLAGFRTGAIESSVAPWGGACQSVLFAFAEAEREHPRGVIGFFDISQRPKIDRELLTYTMPHRLFLEMESSVEASFLRSADWQKLRERR